MVTVNNATDDTVSLASLAHSLAVIANGLHFIFRFSSASDPLSFQHSKLWLPILRLTTAPKVCVCFDVFVLKLTSIIDSFLKRAGCAFPSDGSNFSCRF
jgi:hypothetical protein